MSEIEKFPAIRLYIIKVFILKPLLCLGNTNSYFKKMIKRDFLTTLKLQFYCVSAVNSAKKNKI